MTTRKSPADFGRLSRAFLFLALAWLVGCAALDEEPSGPIVHHQDSSVLDDQGQGAKLKLLNFSWRYLKKTDQIRVNGAVLNTSGRPFQGGRILVSGFDQFDRLLGEAETFLNPTYIPAGNKARFEIYFERGKWVNALHLRYRFESRH